MPFWSLMNRTPSTSSFSPSPRMPAPFASGTRARVKVRLRMVTSAPAVMNSALPLQDLSVMTTLSASPTPSTTSLLASQVAQSKYSPG